VIWIVLAIIKFMKGAGLYQLAHWVHRRCRLFLTNMQNLFIWQLSTAYFN